jgi:uncharacterized membrane protein YeiH
MMAIIEAVGVFAFAVSGALLAVRRGFDIVGVLVLAVLTAIGGGVLRDVLLGDTPPDAFTEWPYFAAPIAAALVTFRFANAIERSMRALLLADAAGLGLFCVAGTVKALDYGLGPLPAAALGVTTGVGGGLLRDVVARETPVLVDPRSELYAIPAIGGALAVAVLWELEAYAPVYGLAIAAAIFLVRLAALKRGWRAPAARPPGAPPPAG